jgi:hypothetical protein
MIRSLLVLFLLPLIVQARPPQAPPPVRPAQAPAPMTCDCSPCICGANCICDYCGAYERSKSTGRPLIVFVNCEARKINGCESCRVNEMNGRKGPCILVTRNQIIQDEFSSIVSTDQIVRAAFPPPPVTAAPPQPTNFQPAAFQPMMSQPVMMAQMQPMMGNCST